MHWILSPKDAIAVYEELRYRNISTQTIELSGDTAIISSRMRAEIFTICGTLGVRVFPSRSDIQ